MRVAVNHETDNKGIKFNQEDLILPVPPHIVKGYYILRYLKARDFKIKILNALNYFREI